MINKDDGKRHEVKVQFSWYGTTSKKDKSGAYLFLPDGEAKVSAKELSSEQALIERVMKKKLSASHYLVIC